MGFNSGFKGLTCDMDKSSLRHIHDPVLLSLKVEVICCINFLAYQELVLAYQELKLTFHSNNNQVYILLQHFRYRTQVLLEPQTVAYRTHESELIV